MTENLSNQLSGVAQAGADIFNLGFNIFDRAENRRRWQETMSREDNAVQRRVADLKAAGLSPTLAAGSAAASSSMAGASGSFNSGMSRALQNMYTENQIEAAELDNEGKAIENVNFALNGEKLKAEVDYIKSQNAETQAKLTLAGDTHMLNTMELEKQQVVIEQIQKQIELLDLQKLHLSAQDREIAQRIVNMKTENNLNGQRIVNQNLVNDAKRIDNEYLREQIETALAQSYVDLSTSSMENEYIQRTGAKMSEGAKLGTFNLTFGADRIVQLGKDFKRSFGW